MGRPLNSCEGGEAAGSFPFENLVALAARLAVVLGCCAGGNKNKLSQALGPEVRDGFGAGSESMEGKMAD